MGVVERARGRFARGREGVTVRVIATGGTFDKEYNERSGTLYFKHTHLREILKLGRCRVPVKITELMLIDSLRMTPRRRKA